MKRAELCVQRGKSCGLCPFSVPVHQSGRHQLTPGTRPYAAVIGLAVIGRSSRVAGDTGPYARCQPRFEGGTIGVTTPAKASTIGVTTLAKRIHVTCNGRALLVKKSTEPALVAICILSRCVLEYVLGILLDESL